MRSVGTILHGMGLSTHLVLDNLLADVKILARIIRAALLRVISPTNNSQLVFDVIVVAAAIVVAVTHVLVTTSSPVTSARLATSGPRGGTRWELRSISFLEFFPFFFHLLKLLSLLILCWSFP